MNQDKDSMYNDPELMDIVHRYQAMVRNGEKCYFDVYEYEMLIEHFLQNGQIHNANKVVELGLSQFPKSTALQLRKAQILIDKGNNNEALKILDEVETIEQGNSEIFLLKGIVNNFTGRQVDAKEYFTKALSLADENRLDVLYSIAVNYENLNDFDTAIQYLSEALEDEKDNITILFELGYCADRIEDFTSAIKYYDSYLDIDPFSDVVWFNLGIVYSKTLEFNKAIEAYDFSIALNEKYSLAYFNKGNALANCGKYTEAIDTYKEYLAYEEFHTETICYIGECYERLNNLSAAVYYYDKALELDPSYSDAIYGLGIICSINEEYTKSLEYINKAISINPSNSDYWFSLGSVYEKLNNKESAIEAYEQSTSLDPNDYESWLNLSEIYFKKNLLSKAIKVLEEAYIYNSDIASINYRLAAFNLLKHNNSEGMSYFRKGINNSFEDHTEVFKFFPQASELKEIKELILHFNPIKS